MTTLIKSLRKDDRFMYKGEVYVVEKSLNKRSNAPLLAFFVQEMRREFANPEMEVQKFIEITKKKR